MTEDSEHFNSSRGTFTCSQGLLIPTYIERDWSTNTRACLYLVALLYSFLGIAILADVFMCGIERITSATRRVKVVHIESNKNDDRNMVEYKEVLVWNPTVANLTLMALGSSAPEILLSIIEIVGNNFRAGELGPGTIVGSAAYNLMAITAVCIVALPKNETKRISQISVFFVTAAWSTFAYIWLIIILIMSSKDEIEVWEGTLTLVFFFLLIITAYITDKKWCEKCVKRKSTQEGDEEQSTPLKTIENPIASHRSVPNNSNEGETNQEWREIKRRAKLEFPDICAEELAKLVAFRIHMQRQHSYAEHRINAIRKMSKSAKTTAFFDPTLLSVPVGKGAAEGAPKFLKVEFNAQVYGIDPSVDKRVRLKIIRRGHTHKQIMFRYETVNGTAMKETHFLPKTETLIFEPNETEKYITIDLVDDAKWKTKDMFTVKLGIDPSLVDEKVKIGKCNPVEIVYVGKDPEFVSNTSTVEFVNHSAAVKENEGHVRLPVKRKGNCKENASLEWSAEDITAKEGADYTGHLGTIEFDEGEIEKYFDIPIIDDALVEKNEMFLVRLTTPSRNVNIGHNSRCVVTIIDDDSACRLFNKLDHLVPKVLASLQPGKLNWKQQFVTFLNVNGGDVSNATMGDYLGHILSFPWKLIAACVPPPCFFGGWLTFVVALAFMGLVVTLVVDIAGTFGCLVGLESTITAITFVALGTSLPDTFASRVAAIQDKDADNAIGNVTGSNSVNVFLGLGLPWFIASIYWGTKGQRFHVSSDGLDFSVTIYTVCSVFTIGLLLARRYLPFFGKAEIGGPSMTKWACALFLLLLWFFYVLLSALEVYGHISVKF